MAKPAARATADSLNTECGRRLPGVAVKSHPSVSAAQYGVASHDVYPVLISMGRFDVEYRDIKRDARQGSVTFLY